MILLTISLGVLDGPPWSLIFRAICIHLWLYGYIYWAARKYSPTSCTCTYSRTRMARKLMVEWEARSMLIIRIATVCKFIGAHICTYAPGRYAIARDSISSIQNSARENVRTVRESVSVMQDCQGNEMSGYWYEVMLVYCVDAVALLHCGKQKEDDFDRAGINSIGLGQWPNFNGTWRFCKCAQASL